MGERKQAIRRVVCLYDQHYPECVPAFWDMAKPKAWTPVLKFLKDFQPHVLIHGGDSLDLSCVSHWNLGKPLLVEGKRLALDYKGYNGVLDRLDEVCKEVEDKVFLTGNHEAWLQLLLESSPQLEGLIEFDKHLALRSRGYSLIARRGIFKVGKLHFIHGDYKERYVPIYHARAIAELFNKNMVYGHFHTHQEYVRVSPYDAHPIAAMSVGTLGRVNPVWLRNAPNAWVNSFGVAYVRENGNYNFQRVVISGGGFVFEGEVYE